MNESVQKVCETQDGLSGIFTHVMNNNFLLLVIIVVAMFLFSIFQEKGNKKKKEELFNSLEKGKIVELNNGIVGTISEVNKENCSLTIKSGTTIIEITFDLIKSVKSNKNI